jgi:hypothetical protein
MTHPLDASRVKVREANQKFRRLDESVQGIFDDGPYQMIREFDSESRQHPVRAKRMADLPLIEWGAVVGSIAHDLRSALNYVVTELVRAYSQTQPGRQHEFPIFDDPAAYHEVGKKGPTKRSGLYRIKGIHPAAATLIESLQPYNVLATATTPKPLSYSTLWALHELNRVDKHQELIAPVPIVRSLTINAEESFFRLDEHIDPGPLEDDAVLYRITQLGDAEIQGLNVHVPQSTGPVHMAFGNAPYSKVAVHAHFTFDIAFSQSGPTKGDLVLDGIGKMLGRTLQTIESFARFV